MKPVFKLLRAGSLLFAALLTVSSLTAGNTPSREFSKTINKQFSIASNGMIALSNLHGKIDIKTWDQNNVRISVKILVDAQSEEDAQEVFERINIRFANSSSNVSTSVLSLKTR